jgi:hypothetical protein
MPSGEARAKWREVQDIGKAWGGGGALFWSDGGANMAKIC